MYLASPRNSPGFDYYLKHKDNIEFFWFFCYHIICLLIEKNTVELIDEQ